MMGGIGTGQVRRVWRLLVISAILAAAKPAVSSGKDDGKQPMDRTRIVMLTPMYSENVGAFSTNALKVMCDELAVTGFTVVRETPEVEMETSLKRTVSDSLYRHRSYVAVVVLRSSQTEGTVTLFGRKGLDEVVDLDSMYVEFPMNRDKAELVAFKVSEKVALLSEGLMYSPSPVVAANPVLSEAETAKKKTEEELEPTDASPEVNRSFGSNYGVFTYGGGMYGLRRDYHTMGFLGGVGGGLRWWSLGVHKAMEVDVLYCPWSNTVRLDEVGEAGIQLMMVRLTAYHLFQISDRFVLNVGVGLGIGQLRANGEKRFSDDAIMADVDDTKGFTGVSGLLAYSLHRNIAIRLRASLGSIWPEEKISVSLDGREENIHKSSRYFGPLVLEAFLGIQVALK